MAPLDCFYCCVPLCMLWRDSPCCACKAALEKEITETLTAWKSHLHAADLVFLQASGVNARPICHGGSPLVNRADPRVRSIPFNTR